MDNHQWEYCQLLLFTVDKVKEGFTYQLELDYLGMTKYILSTIEEKTSRVFTYNPFNAAIGLLGLEQWELVGVQHAISNDVESLGNWGEGHSESLIKRGSAIAYFKRRIDPSRPRPYPPIILPD